MDAVLITMGLFGVRIDLYTLLSGTHKRLAATINLLQAYLDHGRQAWWPVFFFFDGAFSVFFLATDV
jgi:hypothetical protein